MSGELLKFLQNNNKNMTKISRKMQNKINDFAL